MIFPKIKKTVKSFLLDENGAIPKKSIMVLGMIGLFSASVESFGLSKHCKILLSCDKGFTSGPVTRGVDMHTNCPESISDDDCDAGSSWLGSANDENSYKHYIKRNDGDSFTYIGEIRFEDLMAHSNSIRLMTFSESVKGHHAHSLVSGAESGSSCNVEFKAIGDEDPRGSFEGISCSSTDDNDAVVGCWFEPNDDPDLEIVETSGSYCHQVDT